MATTHGGNDDSKRSKTNAASFIPSDFVPGILARLPVKPLLRFSSVCKSWGALISRPEFAKKQRLLAPSAYPSRIHLISFEDGGFKDYPLPSLLTDASSSAPATAAPMLRNFPIGKESHCEIVCGSCHGMLFFANEGEGLALVLNPSTGKFRTLPRIEFRGGLDYPPPTGYGFGYDHVGDCYKVVVASRYETSSGYDEVDVRVHTLGGAGEDPWRGINEAFPDGFDPGRLELGVPGRLVSGTLNWLFVDYEDDENTCVASLDLGTETFQELLLPPFCEDYDEIYELNLAVLMGGLSILVDGDDRSDFWVMKDYGNPETWTKVFSIPFPYGEHSSHPLSIRGEDDEVFLEDKSTLFVHDSESLIPITTTTDLDFRGFDKFNGVDVVSYAYSESLICP